MLCYNVFNIQAVITKRQSIVKYSVSAIILSVLLASLFLSTAIASEDVFEEIEWTDLIPRDDLAILLDPPEFLLGIEDGSENDNMETLAEKSKDDAKTKRFNEALKSERVITEFDGRKIRIPGFIVPLKNNAQQQVTEFFIVPYFGACLHLPPPPPNQIIHGRWPAGIDVEDLSIPMWFEGEIDIKKTSSEMGTSVYDLSLTRYLPY
jgi:hypothetical protein